MAYTCDICGKRHLVGNNVSHSNIKTKTIQHPNLVRVHAVVDGVRRHVRVCTRCLRTGSIIKAS